MIESQAIKNIYQLRIRLRFKRDKPVVIVGKLTIDEFGQVIALKERFNFLHKWKPNVI